MAATPERRILIVDDEPHLVDAVRMYLELESYVALSATSGREALVKLRELLPDLVILDVMMPEMDRFETLRRVAKTTVEVDEDLTIDFSRAEVFLRGQRVQLPPTEYRQLYHLASNP